MSLIRKTPLTKGNVTYLLSDRIRNYSARLYLLNKKSMLEDILEYE